MLKIVFWLLMLFAVPSFAKTKNAWAASENQPNIAKLEQRLLGDHRFLVHWLSASPSGTLSIHWVKQKMMLKGRQDVGDSWATLYGELKPINAHAFLFEGEMVMFVPQLFGVAECRRVGRFVFRHKVERSFWRMQDKRSSCYDGFNVIDIYQSAPGEDFASRRLPSVDAK